MSREEGRHSITDLAADRSHRLLLREGKHVIEPHAARRFADRYRTIGDWMEVAPFLGFVELGANRDCGPVPPQTPEDICGASRLLLETREDEMGLPLLLEVTLHLES